MGILQLTNNFSAQYSNAWRGGMPAWYDSDSGAQFEKFKNRNNWWYDNNVDIMYNITGNTATVQYGLNRSDYASARALWEKIDISNEVQHDDGSVTADITITLSSIVGCKTSMSQAGYPAVTTVYLAGQQVAQRSGNTIDTFNMYPNPSSITKRVTVGPQQKSNQLDLVYHTDYPTGVYPNNDIKLGMTVYNPTPPNYIPMALRRGRNWDSLNSNHGFIKIRKSGNWQDKSKENSNTSRHDNAGHNRIRKNGVWKQLPKM